MPVGERVRALRNRKALSQAELAAAAGITSNTLYRIETGMHSPRPGTIRKLAKALEVRPEDLTIPAEEAASK